MTCIKIIDLTAATLWKKAFSDVVSWYIGNQFAYKGENLNHSLAYVQVKNTSETATILYCIDDEVIDGNIVAGNDGIGIISSNSVTTLGGQISNLRLLPSENCTIELILE